NVALNGQKDVPLVERAVSDTRTPMRLRGSSGFNQSAAYFVPASDTATGLEITTDPVVIDDYATTIGRVDFIKVDSQGADMRVLSGASRTVTKWKPTLLLCSVSQDLYQRQSSGVADVVAFLHQHGYVLSWLQASTPIPRDELAFDSKFVGMVLALPHD